MNESEPLNAVEDCEESGAMESDHGDASEEAETTEADDDTVLESGSASRGRTDPTLERSEASQPAETSATSSDRWTFALAVALGCVGIGVLVADAALVLAGVVALTYAAYGYATAPPTPTLTVSRTLEPANPVPGDAVTVTVSVVNAGRKALPDVRVTDGVHAELRVDGRQRAVGSLEPGESLRWSYTVVARRGTYTFDPVTVTTRNVSGSERRTLTFEPETTVTADDALERVPLAGQTIQHTGRVETDIGGEGIEFFSIREFQPTDPMNRVDWNRLARTGELTTVEFREERAAAVVVVVDQRHETVVARVPDEPTGRELTTHAGEWLASAMLGENNRVGVTLYGGRGDYLLPRSGRDQLARVKRLLDGEWCGSFGRPAWLSQGDRSVDRFCRHLADEKQIVFVTPLLDDEPVDSAQRFLAHGHAVTLVCPMVGARADEAGLVDRLAVERRLSTLRSHGVRVVEWSPDESLHAAVSRGKRRWSG
ncbi:DUF58 domain-containing protein [Natronosalvus amylolyticus]|uniref:DUF58 domain-containing protein n=1 Tax=Natronosalvus amylolyticus TaxID=2961994 RepID=UPI0020C93EEA|nr:DUF58 domain-containing protein [Natronosalvus amylolyticus]